MSRLPRGRLMSHPLFKVTMAVLSVLCAAPSDCGGGGNGSQIPTNTYVIPSQTTQNLTGGAGPSDVDTIIRQAINEATARHTPATIAVVDRLGNVLGVIQMPGAPTTVTVTSMTGVTGGLEGVQVPATLAAVSKAITGAYLSSGGNAFSTRTASQIVQQHINPGVTNAPSGPLFGVQFSQLPCSDFNQYLASLAGARANVTGPQRAPLGLAADPGGLPVYKSGVMVGGIGVVTKTTYTLDLNVFDFDQDTPAGDNDEIIAIAGTTGYAAPQPIQATNISAGGITLRYTDASSANLATAVALAPEPFPGEEVSVTGFYVKSGAPRTGVTWGSAAAGVFPDGSGFTAPFVSPGPAAPAPGAQYPGVVAWTFFDPTTGVERVPRGGFTPGGGLAITATEARNLVISGLTIAYQTRGQIRIPTNSNAEISVAIVDLDGNLLAMARTTEAPVFGADVSVQKARSVVYFSRADAHSAYNDINAITTPDPDTPTGTFSYYMTAQSLNDPTLFNQGTAFSDRALGDLARPFYPDGIDGSPNGPLSLPLSLWSVFSDGLQLDLVKPDIVAYGAGGAPPPVAGCGNNTGGTSGIPLSGVGDNRTRLADGMQIFPGGEPIYRGNTLVGAIGVSGDGVQQDDMVSFLGLADYTPDPAQSVALQNAPAAIRADQLSPAGTPLSYVICPAAPFLNSRVQNPC